MKHQFAVAASGKIVIVAMDRETERATEVPGSIREKLQPWVAPRVSA